MRFLGYLSAFIAGVAIACQTGSNSELKEKIGEPTAALVINYVVAINCVLMYMLLTRQPMPSLQGTGQVRWWGWLGGLLGAASGIVARRLGAGALAACALAGQLIGSVVLDHFGWLGFELHALNWPRIAGCCLMTAGLVLISRF
jgi:bacterial/archaeal transporter family-2 protein